MMLIVCTGIVMLCTVPATQAAVLSIWNGSVTGNWSESSKWSTASYPNNVSGGTVYDAQIGAGTVTLDRNIVLNNFNFSAGQVAGGTNSLTIDGVFNWTGGSLWQGTVYANGGMAISGSARKEITGSMLLQHTGTTTWSGNGEISSYSGATLNNMAGSTFDLQGNGTMAGFVFNNAGTFSKTAGDANFISGGFNNSGSVQVGNNLHVYFDGYGSHTGTFTVNPGATLGLGSYSRSGEHTFEAASIINSQGKVLIRLDTGNFYGTLNNSGETEISSGTSFFRPGAVVNFGSSLALGGRVELMTGSSHTLPATTFGGWLGGSDAVTFGGGLAWNGGNIAGTGKKTLGTTTMTNGGRIRGLAVDNTGTFTWNSGTFYADPGTVFDNKAGAVFEIKSNSPFEPTDLAMWQQVTFNNNGTYRKAPGSNYSNNYAVFNNYGTVEAQSDLGFGRRLNNYGMASVSSGATIALSNGTHTLAAGSQFGGNGNVTISSSTVNVAGTFDIKGRTDLNNSTLNFDAGASVPGIGGELNVPIGSALNLNTGSEVVFNDAFVEGPVSGSDTIRLKGTLTSRRATIANNLINEGDLSPGTLTGILTLSGSLTNTAGSQMHFEIGGRIRGTTNSDYDHISVAGPVTLGGLFNVKLINGFEAFVTGSDQFPVIAGGSSLAGAFENAISGQRILTEGGSGSFLIYYGSGSPFGEQNVVLTSYAAVPEPSGMTLAVVLSSLVLLRRR